VGHASRSSGLFHLDASQARVFNLPQNWRMSNGGWFTWHHHGSRVKMKSKMNWSMRQVVSDSSTHNFIIFVVLGTRYILVF
jgi:hypothetical protein